MRGAFLRRFAALGLCLSVAFIAAAGCRTSVTSGLPGHIRTVEVHIFQNKTMYKGIEGVLTRSIIDRVNMDPRIRTASGAGDAVLTGEIIRVDRQTVRETTTNEPGTVRITITASYSLYDVEARRYLIEDVEVTSSATGMSFGLYEASRGGDSEEGERSAANALAGEIVRRTIGMW